MSKILKTTASRHRTRKIRVYFLKEEQKQGEFYDCLSVPAKQNLQTKVHRVGNKTELEELNWGDEVWSLGKLSQLEFVEQNHREEGVAQKKGSDSFIGVNSSLCLSAVLHKCVRKLPKRKKIKEIIWQNNRIGNNYNATI